MDELLDGLFMCLSVLAVVQAMGHGGIEWMGPCLSTPARLLVRTVHGITLAIIVALVLCEKELEIVVGVVERADLVLVVDKVAGTGQSGAVNGRFPAGNNLPKPLQIRREVRIPREIGPQATKHIEMTGQLCMSSWAMNVMDLLQSISR